MGLTLERNTNCNSRKIEKNKQQLQLQKLMDDNQEITDTTRAGSIQTESPLLAPGSIALLTLMAGPQISLFPSFSVCKRVKASFAIRLLFLLLAITYPTAIIALLLWRTEWYWSALIVISMQILASVIYYVLLRKLQLAAPEQYKTTFADIFLEKSSYILAGIAGGMFLVPLLGVPVVILFLLASDHFLFTFMPVAFDDATSLVLLTFGIMSLVMSGAVAGGWLGKIRLKMRPIAALGYAFALIWITMLWYLILQLTIVLPGFLSSQAESSASYFSYLFFFFGIIIIGSWWSPYLLMYCLRHQTIFGRFFRCLQIPVVCISSAIIFSFICGYPSNWFQSCGKFFEKEGNVAASKWCYEESISKKPTGEHASYLQYQIAMQSYKLGDRKKAEEGFSKVISMQNYRQDLVIRAGRFLENLKRNSAGKKRVVLPGVENPTAFKGSYCVPNSLAMIMNFWGADINAETIGQAITSLNSGTMVIDQAWFAEQQGFRHEFLPLSDISDIIACIDAGFPVLVYVPSHVFAIVGYDEILETFVTYDVATREIWVDYLRNDFLKSWKKEDTTMIVVYPPDQGKWIPPKIAEAALMTSDRYFQYHLHYLDSPEGYVSEEHLLLASDSRSHFFLPLVTLYKEFPSLRSTLLKKADLPKVTEDITDYFGTNFDEGVHLAGQRHYDDYAEKDYKLASSIDFLIGTGQIKEASSLIDKIELEGKVSPETRETRAILNIAMGDLENAIPRLVEEEDSQLHFYLAQCYLQQNNPNGAIPELVKTIDDCT